MRSIEALHPGKTYRRHQQITRRCEPDTRRIGKPDRQHEEFLALFAHELLTPLTCILGWSQLAHDQQDPAAVRQAFDVIERNARRQKLLIDELLAVIRFTRGFSLTFNPRQIDLWRLVEPYQELPKVALPGGQLILEFDQDDKIS